MTDCRPAGDPGALAVTFGTRRQAEAALAGGATVGPHRLTLGWPAVASAAAKGTGDGVQVGGHCCYGMMVCFDIVGSYAISTL